MKIGDLVQYRSKALEELAPIGIIIGMTPGDDNTLVEWAIHPGLSWWYPHHELKLIASAKENNKGGRPDQADGVLC